MSLWRELGLWNLSACSCVLSKLNLNFALISHLFLFCFLCVLSRSVVSNSLRPHQAPLSMGFSGQECWSGLPFPSPGDHPDPGIKAQSPALHVDSLPS